MKRRYIFFTILFALLISFTPAFALQESDTADCEVCDEVCVCPQETTTEEGEATQEPPETTITEVTTQEQEPPVTTEPAAATTITVITTTPPITTTITATTPPAATSAAATTSAAITTPAATTTRAVTTAATPAATSAVNTTPPPATTTRAVTTAPVTATLAPVTSAPATTPPATTTAPILNTELFTTADEPPTTEPNLTTGEFDTTAQPEITTEEPEITTEPQDPPCECNSCTICGFNGGVYGLGRVLGGSPAREVSILDALEILRFLAGLDNEITGNPNAIIAGRIVNPQGDGMPTISDALEILSKLAGMLNRIDIPYLDNARIITPPVTVRQGQTHTLRFNNRGTVTFVSFNQRVATIDDRGLITALEGGSSHILVYVNGTIHSIYTVIVPITTTSLRVVNAPEFISVGESFALQLDIRPTNTADRTEFTISDRNLARIDNNGVLRGQSAGTFTLTVSSGSISQDIEVTVESPWVSESSLKLVEGEVFEVLTIEGTQRQSTFRSSNPAVATVDADGRVRAHTAGYTCIIATVGQMEFYTDVRVITALEKRITDLQHKYPDGYFWNNHTADSQFPQVSTTPCNHNTDRPRQCKGQCAGYARLISNEVFGENAPRITVNNVESVRQGDYVRYSNRPNHGHSIFIIRVERPGEIIGYNRSTGQHIYASQLTWIVTDCNWWSNCIVIWNRRFDPARFVTEFIANRSYSRQ
jgi:hypothetical protein